MSAITVGGDIVHYEVLGRGRPVVLIHGWVGSWRYWIPIMQQLHLKYRVYALDLFGFGDSAKNPEKYTMDQQIHLLTEFMSQLGLAKAALIGHGLGAQVITEFANQHREMVPRLLISSAPLFDTGDLATRGQKVLLTTQDFDAVKAATLAAEAAPSTATTSTTTSTASIPSPLPSTGSSATGSSTTGTSTGTSQTTTTPASTPSTTPAATSQTGSSQSGSASKGAGGAEVTVAHRGDVVGESDATIPSSRMIDRSRLEQAALARAEAEIAARRAAEKQPEPTPAAASVTSTTSSRLVNLENPLFGRIGKSNSDALLQKCFKKTDPEFGKLSQDVARQDDAVLNKMTGSFDAGKMLDILRGLPMPIVVVHGTDDPIIEAPSENVWTYITTNKEDTLIPIPLPGVRHFPMLEADSFTRLVGNFLEAPDISKIEIKERWKRRSR
ncbi:MAG TPA: alpha/beta hydrolase [Phototrophicaceae bacterium]|jgi:pimeloyl-ACP methyl ester carboxylesterase|nr:alpha/beta hydrolase [Phototrophicaceae bacterium]